MKKNKESKKLKLEISKKEKFFLISLYPKGRNETDILDQLKYKFPETSDTILKGRMTRWIVKLNDMKFIGRINTERHGHIVALTQKGIQYTRKKISNLYNKDLKIFVKIMNRLTSDKNPDPWALKIFEMRARRLVSMNLPFFTVIFFPQKYSKIVANMNAVFNINLTDEKRQKRFKKIVEEMNALGLLDIKEDEAETLIEATEIARSFHADELKVRNVKKDDKYKKKYKKVSHASKDHDKILIQSTLISMTISFILILIVGGIVTVINDIILFEAGLLENKDLSELVLNPAVSLWWMAFVSPLLVPLLYKFYIKKMKNL